MVLTIKQSLALYSKLLIKTFVIGINDQKRYADRAGKIVKQVKISALTTVDP